VVVGVLLFYNRYVRRLSNLFKYHLLDELQQQGKHPFDITIKNCLHGYKKSLIKLAADYVFYIICAEKICSKLILSFHNQLILRAHQVLIQVGFEPRQLNN